MRFILAPSAFLSVVLAQSNDASAKSSTATTIVAVPSSLQTVTAGKGGVKRFDPESLVVPPGSKVVFQFYPGHNSVVQGSFDKPCSPSSNVAFYSGDVDSDSQIFTISVDDKDPIWFYSGSSTHCEEGMVGVINPTQNQTLAIYKSRAATASKTTLPASNNVQGGVLASALSGTTSASTTSATAKGGARTVAVSVFGVVLGSLVAILVAIS
ncbi:hypothetical protein EG328_002226 [Venturia inaequalis]|uniref:Extracellular serine-rich protein n=1 Tax=Venturia inaequalis TaxID=5025 RepID=A0A8H3VGM5_VENIN|nr:hypothetical protein EG328_002226 [Venturia inaequalis]